MIDWSRPVQTRDGREVRIYAKDGGSDFPIHGAINHPRRGWEVRQWGKDGKITSVSEFECDLVNAPRRVKVERWINVYKNGACSTHASRVIADDYSGTGLDRIACIQICSEVEEGEGL